MDQYNAARFHTENDVDSSIARWQGLISN